MIDSDGQWTVCESPYCVHTICYTLESIRNIFMCIGWGSGQILYPSKAASGNAVGHMLITPHHMPPGSTRSATRSHPATCIFLRLHRAAGFVSAEPQGLSFCVLKTGHKGYYYYYYCYYTIWICLSQAFLPGISLEPAVIPTTQASSFTLQYFPYCVWCSEYSCLL